MLFPDVKHKFLNGKHMFQGERQKFFVWKHKQHFDGETFVKRQRNFCRGEKKEKRKRNSKQVKW